MIYHDLKCCDKIAHNHSAGSYWCPHQDCVPRKADAIGGGDCCGDLIRIVAYFPDGRVLESCEVSASEYNGLVRSQVGSPTTTAVDELMKGG